MNLACRLAPEHTVSRAYVGLTAQRPVRVGTYLYYNAADHWQMPDPLDDLHMDCGTTTNRMPNHNSVAPHDHEYCEIVLIRGGCARHRTPLYDEYLRGGTAIVVSPGHVHAFDDIDGLQKTNVYYLTEWLLDDLRYLWGLESLVPLFLASALFRRTHSPRIPVFPLNNEEMAQCVRELNDITVELRRATPSLPYLKWCFLKFLLVLSRAYTRSEPDQPPMSAGPGVCHALQWLESHILDGESFHLAALAREAGMSQDYFSKAFKDATGWSPMDYYQQRRIQYASWLLLNPSSSITEVAHTLGFYDSAHFSNLFKRHQGLSPRAYRKLYMEEPSSVGGPRKRQPHE